jgi:hypothetical protein
VGVSERSGWAAADAWPMWVRARSSSIRLLHELGDLRSGSAQQKSGIVSAHAMHTTAGMAIESAMTVLFSR